MNTIRQKTAVVSICSVNRLHYVRTLMQSVLDVHPDWARIVLLIDDNQDAFNTSEELFEVFGLRQLNLPQFNSFCFRYNADELSRAVKPWMIEELLNQGYERIVFFDPDIRLYHPLVELEKALVDSTIVLIPHLCREHDEASSNELDIIRRGVWDLGFIAVRECRIVRAFLKWWQMRLASQCLDDPNAGLYFDQKWIDLVPGMFRGVFPLRHESYDVAPWNLHRRKVTFERGRFLVNSDPLRFFHFSGLTLEDPTEASEQRLKHFDHSVRDLVREYVRDVHANGFSSYWNRPCSFDRFSNGDLITDEMRRTYRTRRKPQIDAGDDPFQLTADYFGRCGIGQDHKAPSFLSRCVHGIKPLARKLPRPMKDRVKKLSRNVAAAVLDIAPGPSRAPSTAGGRIGWHNRPGDPSLNIVGYLLSELGVGQSARQCVASAESSAINLSLIDFSGGSGSRAQDQSLLPKISNDFRYSVNLIHVNADKISAMMSCLGREAFYSRYNIGYWHWELPEFPDEWQGSFDLVDEIWTPTQFVTNAIAAKSPVPVICIPHAIGFRTSSSATRAQFGLPSDRYLFLMMYDMHSNQSRKNPQAALAAFQRAFPDEDNVGLVIKTMNTQADTKSFALLAERLKSVPNVWLINQTLSRQDAYDLQAVCDCYVSLHRSEGFGLGMAESMYLGKPVIGTNWSGNVDFMNSRNSCPVDYELVALDRDYGPYRKGQIWAEARVEHAAWYMRKLVEDPVYSKRIGEAGRTTIRRDFSYEAIGRRYKQRLRVIALRNGVPVAPTRSNAA